jgi:hypothetical protein
VVVDRRTLKADGHQQFEGYTSKASFNGTSHAGKHKVGEGGGESAGEPRAKLLACSDDRGAKPIPHINISSLTSQLATVMAKQREQTAAADRTPSGAGGALVLESGYETATTSQLPPGATGSSLGAKGKSPLKHADHNIFQRMQDLSSENEVRNFFLHHSEIEII